MLENNVAELQVQEQKHESYVVRKALVMAQKIQTAEIVSEIDMFSTSIQLTIDGDEVYRTCFGGIITLLIMVVCFFVTYTTQIMHEDIAEAPISSYVITKNNLTPQTVFDFANVFLQFAFYDSITGELVKMGNLVQPKVYQVTNQGVQMLQISVDNCSLGEYCFLKNKVNQNATLYGQPMAVDSQWGILYFNLLSCDYTDPTFFDEEGFTKCFDMFKYNLKMFVTNLDPITNELVPSVVTFELVKGLLNNLGMKPAQFTTNQRWRGYLANILSQTFSYYQVGVATGNIPQFNTSFQEIGNQVGTSVLLWSTSQMVIVTQQFYDVTVPLLFFISLSQTFTLLVYYLCLKKYNQNSMYLHIGDSLVYVVDEENSTHYSFKSGWQVIIVCLIFDSLFARITDFFLYRHFCRTFYQCFSDKMRRTIDLINLGKHSLTEDAFFGELSLLCTHENAPLTRIPLNGICQQQTKEEDQQQKQYFQGDEIRNEAFKQFCECNEYTQNKSKNHMYQLLCDRKRKYYLVYETQRNFEEYVERVKIQRKKLENAQIKCSLIEKIKYHQKDGINENVGLSDMSFNSPNFLSQNSSLCGANLIKNVK